MLRVWRAVWITVHGPVEYIYLALGQVMSKVVESSPMTKAKLKDNSRLLGDIGEGPSQTGMLGFQPVIEFFETCEA